MTHCANYLVCIGSLGVALRRSHAVMDPKLKLLLAEVLFAYQIDWRYPKPFDIVPGAPVVDLAHDSRRRKGTLLDGPGPPSAEMPTRS